MSTEWYLYKNQQQEGPLTWEQLVEKAEAGDLGPADMVWTEGMDGWARADQVEGLVAAAPPAAPEPVFAPPPPPRIGTPRSVAFVETLPAQKKGKGRINIAIIAVLSLIVMVGGFFAFNAFLANRVTAEEESMLATIPEEIRAVIPSEFSFEFEYTREMREAVAPLDEAIQDTIVRQLWYFSYSGTVEEALGALAVPSEAIVVEPYETSVVEIINSILLYGGDELEEEMGAAWFEKAYSRSVEWENAKQHCAEVIFAYEGETVFELLSSNEKPIENNTGEIMGLDQWSITIVSPFIDLDQIELVEETLITVMHVDYQF